MKWYHEKLQHDIEVYRKLIKEKQQILRDKKDFTHRNLQLEIIRLWEDLDYGIGYESRCEVKLSLSNPLTPDQWEEVWNMFDEVLTPRGYEFYQPGREPLDNMIEYHYYNRETKKKIEITISSSCCNRVPTGKMIPEYKTDCNLVKMEDSC